MPLTVRVWRYSLPLPENLITKPLTGEQRALEAAHPADGVFETRVPCDHVTGIDG